MKLPDFLFKYVSKHQTSLGDNLAFPTEKKYPFDYQILKERMEEVHNNASKLLGDKINITKAQNLLSKYLAVCQKIEEPFQEYLEKICEKTIHNIFSIPKETIQLNCKLTNKITPNHPFRILPEDIDDDDFSFEDIEDIENVNKVVLKRRFINALIQGAAYRYGNLIDFYQKDINNIDENLINLYKKIIILNDYLLFNKKEHISDKNPKQGAVVEVELGREGEKTEINVQGTNFIFLLTETIRGFFELFASHGLPEDNKKALQIIKQADFLIAEPWDLRMGVPLWDKIMFGVDDTKIMPYFFTNLCKLQVDDFNKNVKEILSKTKKGQSFIEQLLKTSEKEMELYNIEFFIKNKNDNETLINDNYFTADELNDETNEVIEECFTIEELNEEIKKETQDELLAKMLIEASWEDIDFNEEEINIPTIGYSKKHMWALNVIVNKTQIPERMVKFRAESVFLGEKMFYQLHIYVDEMLRRKGIAFKLYQAFINIFGNAISVNKNRVATFNKENYCETNNDEAISNLWNKLSNDSNILIKHLNNKKGENVGIIAFKK